MGSSSHLDTAIQELTSDIFSVVPIQQKKKQKKTCTCFFTYYCNDNYVIYHINFNFIAQYKIL